MEQKSQNIIPNNIEESSDLFYVTPSLQNVVLTPTGKFLDIVLSNQIGVWDIETGQCQQVISGIATGEVNKLYPFVTQQNTQQQQNINDYVYVVCDNIIKLLDLSTNKVIKELPQPDLSVTRIASQGKQLVIVGYNKIHYYPNILEKSDKFDVFPTQQYSKDDDNNIDSAIILENGNIVFYSQGYPDIHLLNPEDPENIRQISHSGNIISMIPMSDSQFAVGHNQSIHIIDSDRNCIKNMLKGYSEEYLTLLYMKEQNYIISGTNKSLIRIWDLKKCRNLNKFGSELDQEYHQLFVYKSNLMSVNNKLRRLKLWDIEDPKKTRSLKFMQGGLKTVQKVVKIDQNTVAMIITRGQFTDGQLDFTQYLEVINIFTNEHLLDVSLEIPGYSLDINSFLYSKDLQQIFYLMKSEDITKPNILNFKEFQNDKKLYQVQFNVEEHSKAFFFSFGRIVIPYNLQFDYSKVFGFPGTGQIQTQSGISVYDFNIKLRMKIQFESSFQAEVIEMQDQNNLIFLNKDNKLEFWDLQKQQRTQIVETHPNIFKQITQIDQYLFLLSHNKEEFVLWDEDFDIVQRRKAKKDMVKIELFGEDCIILYKGGQLELWNVESGDYRDSKINYTVCDFIVQDKTILLVGEGFMQVTNRDKL